MANEKNDLEKYECDRCGFTFYKIDLIEQKGLLVCDKCYDEPSYRESENE